MQILGTMAGYGEDLGGNLRYSFQTLQFVLVDSNHSQNQYHTLYLTKQTPILNLRHSSQQLHR